MSLARDIAFDTHAGTLLRYGQLRQSADAFCDGFRSAGMAVVPALLVEGVLPQVLQSFLPGDGPLDTLQAMRQHPWLNQLGWELASGTLVRILEAMTAQSHLLPDPYFACGGLGRAGWPVLPAVHPGWQLPPALVLDLVLNGRFACEMAGQPGLALQPGQALLWAADASPPVCQAAPAAVYWRAVFFRGVLA